MAGKRGEQEFGWDESEEEFFTSGNLKPVEQSGSVSSMESGPVSTALRVAPAVPTWALAVIGVSVCGNLALGLHMLASRDSNLDSNAASKNGAAPLAGAMIAGSTLEILPEEGFAEGSGSGEGFVAEGSGSGEGFVAEGSGSGDPSLEVASVDTGTVVPAEFSTGHAVIAGSIPASLGPIAGGRGDALSAAFNRLVMWDLDVRRDLRAGDEASVAWQETANNAQVVIGAASYKSTKFKKSLTAFRFQATGDTMPRYWSADGKEVEFRLNKSPIENYDQVTSLLKDRPTHHGMDFKTPVGTPITSPWAGVVTKANWNWGANGNCLEIAFSNGNTGKFLHLSENKVKAGDRITAGEVIALSGNTGHSTGPHLHYQLEKAGEILDPVKVHGTFRRELPETDRTRFQAEVGRMTATLAAK